jgi:spermidine/putrescine-binding protein
MRFKRLVMSIVGLALIILFSFWGLAAPAHAKDCTLRIIGWEGYMDESFAQPFEKQYGCKD